MQYAIKITVPKNDDGIERSMTIGPLGEGNVQAVCDYLQTNYPACSLQRIVLGTMADWEGGLGRFWRKKA